MLALDNFGTFNSGNFGIADFGTVALVTSGL